MRTLTAVAAVVTFLACAPALAHGRLADISVADRGSFAERVRALAARTNRPDDVGVIGIIREPIHVAPTPRPFPGFVPDPRG
jgi:hypothetical protein